MSSDVIRNSYVTVSRKRSKIARFVSMKNFQQKKNCCLVLIKNRAIITPQFLVWAQRMSNTVQFAWSKKCSITLEWSGITIYVEMNRNFGVKILNKASLFLSYHYQELLTFPARWVWFYRSLGPHILLAHSTQITMMVDEFTASLKRRYKRF